MKLKELMQKISYEQKDKSVIVHELVNKGKGTEWESKEITRENLQGYEKHTVGSFKIKNNHLEVVVYRFKA